MRSGPTLLLLDRFEQKNLHLLSNPFGRWYGYAMPNATGKAMNLHLTEGALCTVIKSQFLQVVNGNIGKATVFEVA